MYIYFLLILQYLLYLHAIAINVALRQCGGVAVEGRIKNPSRLSATNRFETRGIYDELM